MRSETAESQSEPRRALQNSVKILLKYFKSLKFKKINITLKSQMNLCVTMLTLILR